MLRYEIQKKQRQAYYFISPLAVNAVSVLNPLLTNFCWIFLNAITLGAAPGSNRSRSTLASLDEAMQQSTCTYMIDNLLGNIHVGQQYYKEQKYKSGSDGKKLTFGLSCSRGEFIVNKIWLMFSRRSVAVTAPFWP